MENDNGLVSQSAEIAITAASSLVGFVMGGPLGAVVGGVTTPVIKLAYQIVQQWADRRKQRLSSALDKAFSQTGLSDEDVLKRLSNDPLLSDDTIRLLRQLIDTDPELDALFASIIASLISTPEADERRRLIVLSDSIRGLSSVQLQIIQTIAKHNNILSASDISICVGVPEIELRNAVRDLELRGIITDNNSYPTVWELRELGKAIYSIILDAEENHGN